MTKSNFGKYFRYKLGKRKSSVIVFAILNFLSTIMPCVILSSYYNNAKKEIEANQGGWFYVAEYSRFAYYLMVASAVICMIMITITTVKSLKFYYNRAVMDTLGCLPLSYGERFWGDLLSNICANFISLVPFSIISLIMTNNIKSVRRKILEMGEPYFVEADMPGMLSTLIFILIFVYIGIYAVTTFVSSCCGKFGSAVLYSFVTMAIPSGIFAAYANYFFSFVIGADVYNEIGSNVSMLPPFGVIISIVMHLIDPSIEDASKYDFGYITERPHCLIVSIIITAAFIVGAYFIGKKRRAEKTGEEFMFRSVHRILSLLLVAMIIGVASSNFSKEKGILGVLFVLLISFLIHIILELSQNKKLKGFWKSVLGFAAVFGACFAFLTIIKTTNSFNYYKKLPSEGSITEIRISGEYFYTGMSSNDDKGYIYKSKDSISEILSEHKKLLMSDEIKTGSKLNITYITKGGGKFIRRYSVENDSEAIKNFSKNVKALEEFDPDILGILNNSDFSGMTAYFDRFHNNMDMPFGIIRDDKINELAELLRYDIENHYFADSHAIGYLEFWEKQANKHNTPLEVYRISEEYEDTVKFLNNRDNYFNLGEDSPASYNINYWTNGAEETLSNILISVSEEDTSEYAKELLFYIEAKNSTDEYSPNIRISDNNGLSGYGVRIENENAAIKAMLKLFREKYAQ